MWTYHTAQGLWTIGEHGDKVVLLFNGEWLLEGRYPQELLYLVNKGFAKRPSCGLDPASVGLPTNISAWTKQT
jgi:hypothetical protein